MNRGHIQLEYSIFGKIIAICQKITETTFKNSRSKTRKMQIDLIFKKGVRIAISGQILSLLLLPKCALIYTKPQLQKALIAL